MNESIGTSQVFSIMIVFVGVMIVLFIGSIAYSKGFKVRNRVIDVLEKHDGYTNEARAEIEENLAAIGYQIIDRDCPARRDPAYEDRSLNAINDSDYRYCIYEYMTVRGHYYGVLIYIHFDIPLIGRYLEIPVYGETKTLYDTGVTW